MTAVLVAMGLAIVLLAALVIGLLKSHAEILRALHRLGAGEEAGADGHDHSFAASPRPRISADAPADIVGQSLTGSTMKIGVAGVEQRTLLAFLSTGCSACQSLWHDLRSDPTGGVADARLVVVVKGPEAESTSRLRELAPTSATVVQSSPAWDDYGVPVTPYFVLVDGPTGDVIGEGSSASWGQVNSLIVQAGADRTARMAAGAVGTEFRADAELRAAGIGPGHPSLYPDDVPLEGDE